MNKESFFVTINPKIIANWLIDDNLKDYILSIGLPNLKLSNGREVFVPLLNRDDIILNKNTFYLIGYHDFVIKKDYIYVENITGSIYHLFKYNYNNDPSNNYQKIYINNSLEQFINSVFLYKNIVDSINSYDDKLDFDKSVANNDLLKYEEELLRVDNTVNDKHSYWLSLLDIMIENLGDFMDFKNYLTKTKLSMYS